MVDHLRYEGASRIQLTVTSFSFLFGVCGGKDQGCSSRARFENQYNERTLP